MTHRLAMGATTIVKGWRGVKDHSIASPQTTNQSGCSTSCVIEMDLILTEHAECGRHDRTPASPQREAPSRSPRARRIVGVGSPIPGCGSISSHRQLKGVRGPRIQDQSVSQAIFRDRKGSILLANPDVLLVKGDDQHSGPSMLIKGSNLICFKLMTRRQSNSFRFCRAKAVNVDQLH